MERDREKEREEGERKDKFTSRIIDGKRVKKPVVKTRGVNDF